MFKQNRCSDNRPKQPDLREGGLELSRKEGACVDILEILGCFERVVGIMKIYRWSTIFELNLAAILIKNNSSNLVERMYEFGG